jgi:cysteinyl-tRNA synthetase
MAQREWYFPGGGQGSSSSTDVPAADPGVLCFYNSLVDLKVPFVPAAGPNSRQVTWYACGPTVYDSAHMGHARNYVTFDVIRRVLEDYFGYNILYVMNVTDVDDKIIFRARRNYLVAEYRKQNQDSQQVRPCTILHSRATSSVTLHLTAKTAAVAFSLHASRKTPLTMPPFAQGCH